MFGFISSSTIFLGKRSNKGNKDSSKCLEFGHLSWKIPNSSKKVPQNIWIRTGPPHPPLDFYQAEGDFFMWCLPLFPPLTEGARGQESWYRGTRQTQISQKILMKIITFCEKLTLSIWKLDIYFFHIKTMVINWICV